MPYRTDRPKFFFKLELLHRIHVESGKSCQTFGEITPIALAPVAALVQRSQIRLRYAERTALPGIYIPVGCSPLQG